MGVWRWDDGDLMEGGGGGGEGGFAEERITLQEC